MGRVKKIEYWDQGVCVWGGGGGLKISSQPKTRNVFKKDNGREIYVLLYNVSNTVIYQLEH